jgi:hypothetical protein
MRPVHILSTSLAEYWVYLPEKLLISSGKLLSILLLSCTSKRVDDLRGYFWEEKGNFERNINFYDEF